MNGIEANGMTAFLPLLWVLALNLAVGLAVVNKRKYERMNKRIGVEMELIKTSSIRGSPHEKMANWITKRIQLNDSLKSDKTRRMLKRIRVGFEGYTHEVMNRTKLVTDSSLNHGGFEIVSPPLSGDSEQRSWLSRICSALRGVAGVDSSCGVHVHVGLKDYETGEWLVQSTDENYSDYDQAKSIVGRVGYAYGWFQEPMNKLVSRSRRNGRWSHDTKYLVRQFANPNEIELEPRWNDDKEDYDAPLKSTDPIRIGLEMYNSLYSHGRYQCVNPEAFGKYEPLSLGHIKVVLMQTRFRIGLTFATCLPADVLTNLGLILPTTTVNRITT